MRNLKGELLCLKTEDIKPNFSELSRVYGIDRRTIKKQYLGLINEKEKKKKASVLDKYKALIKEKLEIPGSNKKAVYMYIVMNVDNKIGSYSNFRKYTSKHHDELITKNVDAHVRFETEYGKQLQFDWKGPIKLKNKYNKIFEYLQNLQNENYDEKLQININRICDIDEILSQIIICLEIDLKKEKK